jgi:hypothetical protein
LEDGAVLAGAQSLAQFLLFYFHISDLHLPPRFLSLEETQEEQLNLVKVAKYQWFATPL